MYLSSPIPTLEESWVSLTNIDRTISIISLLDGAFFFFQNFPCRLTHTEMQCDLPCDESLFLSEHPFAEPNFRFSRGLTVSEAFKNLFDEVPESNPMDLTALDMFILIHSMSFAKSFLVYFAPADSMFSFILIYQHPYGTSRLFYTHGLFQESQGKCRGWHKRHHDS